MEKNNGRGEEEETRRRRRGEQFEWMNWFLVLLLVSMVCLRSSAQSSVDYQSGARDAVHGRAWSYPGPTLGPTLVLPWVLPWSYPKKSIKINSSISSCLAGFLAGKAREEGRK